jgi:hypothetical protein
MGIAFEHGSGNKSEIIAELHGIWEGIYSTIGLRQGLSTEALRFAATLKSGKEQPVQTQYPKICSTIFFATWLPTGWLVWRHKSVALPTQRALFSHLVSTLKSGVPRCEPWNNWNEDSHEKNQWSHAECLTGGCVYIHMR